MTQRFEEKVQPAQKKDEHREVEDIFPALKKYRTEHTIDNLRKLCVEVVDFCKAIYASTQNDEERQVLKTDLFEKLNK